MRDASGQFGSDTPEWKDEQIVSFRKAPHQRKDDVTLKNQWRFFADLKRRIMSAPPGLMWSDAAGMWPWVCLHPIPPVGTIRPPYSGHSRAAATGRERKFEVPLTKHVKLPRLPALSFGCSLSIHR